MKKQYTDTPGNSNGALCFRRYGSRISVNLEKRLRDMVETYNDEVRQLLEKILSL